MSHFKKILLGMLAAAFLMSAGACGKAKEEGPAEKAGAAIDQAVDQAKEKAGEAMEKTGDVMKEAGDKVKEAGQEVVDKAKEKK
jgi:hypothetical protein